jgi:murein DD-endopeptidase MepM/ murein hydrolase activator NlpD
MATDVTNRPFAGNWEPNLRKVIRYTPDAMVYINGDTGIPGCASCGGRVDLQPFITSVTCEPSTNPIATATISLSIPKYRSAGLFADGKFALRPGLEVHIYMRGYFPAQNLLSSAATSPTATAASTNNEAMYPYYLVFHGVVTNNSYSYSGGEYTATLSCADLLHFWQYQRLVSQGSILANRPSGSKVNSSWLGHNFSGMTPYAIIYTLYRDVFGAAGGVETNWLNANATNAAAVSSQTGESLFSLNILYWQKRFSQTVANLRMFGANGKVYNANQAAFLGKLTTEASTALAKNYASAEAQSGAKDPGVAYARIARTLGYDPFSVYTTGGGSSSESDTLGTNVAALQAYVSDISKWGQINLLETEYLTKLEIANEVIKETGFEFYQDVDGDIVFKPPFYNMDTSGLRVYRIEPEDVQSFDVSDKEPDVTVVKWTGGHFSNLKVPSLEGEFGKRAEFIDYRLVAQFGWRQETFDTAYYNDERTAYYASIAKMDIYNIAVKSASVTIPLRPELRPGYPVYIVHLDCYYYCTGINHSFSFGATCTSTLTLVGRRAKFHAPGLPPADGRNPTVSDVQMDNMHLPPLPLTLPAGAVSAESSSYSTGSPVNPTRSTGFANTYRKTQGFPNVVMALDPSLINPLQFARGFDPDSLATEQGIRNLIKAVIMGQSGVLQRPPDDRSTADEKAKSFDGPWVIQKANNQWIPLPSVSELVGAARRSATGATDDTTAILGVLVSAARTSYERAFPGAGTAAAALELISDYKSNYAPGKNLPGYYRYYSSAHPDPANQGMLKLAVDDKGQPISTKERYTLRGQATQFSRDGNALVEGDVSAGIPIAVAGETFVVKPTHEIRSFDMARLEVAVTKGRVVQQGARVQAFPMGDLSDALRRYFVEQILDADDYGLTKKIADYKPLFETERDRIAVILGAPSKVPPPTSAPTTVAPTSGGGRSRSFSVDVLENSTGTAEYVTSFFSGDANRTVIVNGKVQSRPHRGVDLRAPIRTPVLAAAPGTVIRVVADQPETRQSGKPGSYGNYGNVVYVNHDGGFQTRYAHLSAVRVSSGQRVKAGDLLGLSGNSGVEAPHLHFELRLNNQAVDPQAYVPYGTSFIAAIQAPTSATPTSSTFNTDYSEGLRSVVFPAQCELVGELPGNDANAKAYTLATMMADAIAGPAADALMQASAAANVSRSNAGKYAAAWAEMFPEGAVTTPLVRDAAGQVVQNNGTAAYLVPVYPVSDELGYEVVGTYPYGRGFNLSDQTFGQLIGPTGEIPDYDRADEFVNQLLQGDGSTAAVAKVIGESNLSTDEKAQLAAAMDPALLKHTEIATALDGAVPGVTGAGANTPASSAQGIGVYSPINVAYGLADMAFGGSDSCSCLSHQADIQLLRAPVDEGYIVIEGAEEDFADYIQSVAQGKVTPWAAAQDNYRGVSIAVGGTEGVVNAYEQARDAAVSRTAAARAGLDQAVEDLRRST